MYHCYSPTCGGNPCLGRLRFKLMRITDYFVPFAVENGCAYVIGFKGRILLYVVQPENVIE